MEKYIIYDSDHPGAINNRCFHASYEKEGPGHSFTVELGRVATHLGFIPLTADVFLTRNIKKPYKAYCITDMVSKRTRKLLQAGVVPFLCISTESPIIARDFYINLKKHAGAYLYSMLFRGVQLKLEGTKTQFLPLYYPVKINGAILNVDWNSRRLLVLVNRNKRIYYSKTTSISDRLRSILSRIKLAYQKMIDPWLSSKEIYVDRIEAIHYFSNVEGFDLYGEGWQEKIPGFSNEYSDSAKKVYKGTIEPDKKLQVISNYRFVLCFENCSFPGYITEKIFDCFQAGCIPIYYGAPDIKDFVPEDSFIDFRNFNDYNALRNYILNFSDNQASAMLKKAREYLSSSQFSKHDESKIINSIFQKVVEYDFKQK
jgi:hypothetical protein